MTRSLSVRIGTWILAVVALLQCTGCTAIGFGVGAAVGSESPRYKKLAAEDQPPAPGTHLWLHVAGQEAGSDEWLDGRYVGQRDGNLIMATRRVEPYSYEEWGVPRESVREGRVKEGSHWGEGAGLGAVIGLAVDVIVVGVVACNFKGPR